MTDTGPLELRDESYVFINEGGTMRMNYRNGRPVTMKESVEMEFKVSVVSIITPKKGSFSASNYKPKEQTYA